MASKSQRRLRRQQQARQRLATSDQPISVGPRALAVVGATQASYQPTSMRQIPAVDSPNLPLLKGDFFRPLGTTGLPRYAGYVRDEPLPELTGTRGIQTFREMEDNSDVIGALLFAVEYLLRSVRWKLIPASSSQPDEEAAAFVESCRNDMSITWPDFISEVMSMLIYGFAYFESIYKLRGGPSQNSASNSLYKDGRIGWRKFLFIPQQTLFRWHFDPEGGLRGMEQLAPPDWVIRYIPIEKALLFRTRIRANNPEGRSILRTSYLSWYSLKEILKIEAIGVERDLCGVPVWGWTERNGDAPGAMDLYPTLFSEQATSLERTLLNNLIAAGQGIRNDEFATAVEPYGWRLKLLATGGRRQFPTNDIITRYRTQIFQAVNAEFLQLGMLAQGTRSLDMTKSERFKLALTGWLDMIAAVLNVYELPRLFRFNSAVFPQISGLPMFAYESISHSSLDEIAAILGASKSKDVAYITPNIDLENHLRSLIDAPALDVPPIKPLPSLQGESEEERAQAVGIPPEGIPTGSGVGPEHLAYIQLQAQAAQALAPKNGTSDTTPAEDDDEEEPQPPRRTTLSLRRASNRNGHRS